MYTPLPACLTILNSNIHGLGLFSTKLIPKETNLGITHIKDERFENGFIRTPLGGFFNHSEDPNIKIVENGDYLEVVTIKVIPPGEELTARYTLYTPT